MSEGFHDHLKKAMEESKIQSAQTFTRKAVKRVCSGFGITTQEVEHDPEFGFQWFHDTFPGFPVRLFAQNLKVDVGAMFKAMTRTTVFIALINCIEETDAPMVGLIVPAYGQGLFIAHNWWGIPEVQGHTRLVRRAIKEKDGLIFEPIESFLTGVQLKGWQP